MMEYKLPPLPDIDGPDVGYYVGETLIKYAEQAVAPLLAEIERLENMCQEKYNQGYDEGHNAGYECCAESMRDE